MNPSVRIIASSGRGGDERREELRSFGVVSFLVKPYNTHDLLVALAEALQDGAGSRS